MSAAIGAPVTVMTNAGEGGAWGIAVLALFALCGGGRLDAFLNGLFADAEKTTVSADEKERTEFAQFTERFKAVLPAEKLAAEVL